jgi:SagB-type dehydrogenase family enzyme
VEVEFPMSQATPAAPVTPPVIPKTPAGLDELFALRRGVFSVAKPDGGVHLLARPHVESVGRLTAGQRAVLRALADQAHAGPALAVLAAAHGDDDHDARGGPDGVAELITRLRAGGWLKVTVVDRGRPLYTVDPLRPPPPQAPPPQVQASLVLSRFTILHRDDEELVLESPRAWCDIRIHDPALLAGVLGRMVGPHAAPPAFPGGDAGPPAADAGRRLTQDLVRAGMAVPGGAEDGELRLRQWSPHELWFHDRSRIGYRGFPGDEFAATFWARGRFDPMPARPEPFPGPTVDLHQPDLDALRRTDPPLTAVLEGRRSLRTQDEANPVTGEQLGEFLYRCARIRREPVMFEGQEITGRPYPGGGGVYELEVYPVVRHAAGLAPGMYHYDSHAHRLHLVRPLSHPAVRRLLRAGVLLDDQPPTQVLLVVSARVGRLMWKYEEMPYTTAMKNLGVFYQTMYLVATAMGLAPCAIGAGDAVAFTEATGRDPLEECGVGEFALGSSPPEPSTR